MTIATAKNILYGSPKIECRVTRTCSDDAPDAALLALAFDDMLKLEDMPSKLGLGFEPWRLPGAAEPVTTFFQYADAVWMLGVGLVPGAETALKCENPRRRRGCPGAGVMRREQF